MGVIDDEILRGTQGDVGDAEAIGVVAGGGPGHNPHRSCPVQTTQTEWSRQLKIAAVGAFAIVIEAVVARKVGVPLQAEEAEVVANACLPDVSGLIIFVLEVAARGEPVIGNTNGSKYNFSDSVPFSENLSYISHANSSRPSHVFGIPVSFDIVNAIKLQSCKIANSVNISNFSLSEVVLLMKAFDLFSYSLNPAFISSKFVVSNEIPISGFFSLTIFVKYGSIPENIPFAGPTFKSIKSISF